MEEQYEDDEELGRKIDEFREWFAKISEALGGSVVG